ncbi:FolC bifunctional protein [Dipodascopsis uninucleata]
MIKLGVERMELVLRALADPQKKFNVIHVAGTNGKGSVCAYISSILAAKGVNIGRFTSPARTPRDGVWLNGSVPSIRLYEDCRAVVHTACERFGATAFEVETATMLELFSRRHIHTAVIEAGVGGRDDATNVSYKRYRGRGNRKINGVEEFGLRSTVLTSIDLDHIGLIGNTIEEIADNKFGICRTGVPLILDATSDERALNVVRKKASEIDVPVVEITDPPSSGIISTRFGQVKLNTHLLGKHQLRNAALAVAALDAGDYDLDVDTIERGLATTTWPGRLQWINWKQRKILVDGAHNDGAARALRSYVDDSLRDPVVWIIAMSNNRDPSNLLRILIRPGDRVIATSFLPIAHMPWVSAVDPIVIENSARGMNVSSVAICNNIDAAMKHGLGNETAVVCGSLYLVDECLSLVEQDAK